MGSLLELQNVETYYGPVMAIRGVSFAVPEGQIVALLGANGAGKTTVLKTISGAMQPQKGSIRFCGSDIVGLDPDSVARLGIAHVPEGREVFPFLSVDDNLRMGAFSRHDADVNADIEAMYDYFPVLKPLAKKQAAYLSGGTAADARDRPRFDVTPRLDVTRRTVAGFVTALGGRNR